MKVLVTGAAGFIGYHVARRLLERGDEVVGIDSINDYYDPEIKEARLRLLAEAGRGTNAGYHFIHGNLADRSVVDGCFADHAFDRVIHLAAQAGVRYSLENPHAYVESNIV
ncbi:MAG: NAD-dependent epimerase/dehydratase family protein, partial [Mesorhizobium sp.]